MKKAKFFSSMLVAAAIFCPFVCFAQHQLNLIEPAPALSPAEVELLDIINRTQKKVWVRIPLVQFHLS